MRTAEEYAIVTLGHVYAKKNHLPDEIAVIAERRDGQWWCCAPGRWDARGPVWVECEMEAVKS